VWDLPSVSADHVERSKRLGLNLFVSRLGIPLEAGATQPVRPDKDFDDLRKALSADPDGVAPDKVKAPMLLGATLVGYGSEGMRQMPILMANDAGLPVGSGFDNRKPEQIIAALDKVTTALSPYPSFRGWSWSSNWWVFDQRGANAAKDADEKK